MNWTALGLVAGGGALGSVARALVAWAIPAGRLPWGTVVANITGSFLIGWLVARFGPLSEENIRAHHFWVVGICGGYTTFSSFSVQTLAEMQKGNWGAAVANVLLSVGLCLFATFLGWRLGR
jgi:CrcB protein